ncbi:hypothetical protein CDAR_580131 [Caerostris darwini]|uniref:Uncharacterized protein n=1 Tax=Caerostris darwini TaxID=1538125 RepID=A0AAV4PM35_9ARAC|nr:hypothetical protein CDAR_580131 [Caerostris darwini]
MNAAPLGSEDETRSKRGYSPSESENQDHYSGNWYQKDFLTNPPILMQQRPSNFYAGRAPSRLPAETRERGEAVLWGASIAGALSPAHIWPSLTSEVSGSETWSQKSRDFFFSRCAILHFIRRNITGGEGVKEEWRIDSVPVPDIRWTEKTVFFRHRIITIQEQGKRQVSFSRSQPNKMATE